MKAATDPLSLAFSALADPTRRAMLERLAEGPARLNDLAEPFDITLQAVSQHLKTLERAGLVTREQVAQTRPATLAPEGLYAANQWLQQYRRFWESSFARLDEHLARMRRAQEGQPWESS